MFRIKNIEETIFDSNMTPCPLGKYDGFPACIADIVIEREGISDAAIAINSNNLGLALANSRNLILQKTGLLVVAKNEYEQLIKSCVRDNDVKMINEANKKIAELEKKIKDMEKESANEIKKAEEKNISKIKELEEKNKLLIKQLKMKL